MPAPEPTELVSRTRAILAYANEDRAELAERAGIKTSDMKAWLDKSKTAHPGMEEVVNLAEAAGVPRRFAERGFEDLRETDGQDAAILRRVVALEEQLRRLVARDARRAVEERQQTDEALPKASQPQRQQQQ